MTADAILEACRGLGLQYEADTRSDGLWRAVCPLCVLHAEGEALTIHERARGGDAVVRCRNGCNSVEIIRHLERAGGEQLDNATTLPFVSAAELRASTPSEPEWLWHGYLAPSALTLLAAKPKAGKSTLAVAVSEAVATDSGSFLGRRIAGGPVVYVAEETAATLAHKLPEVDGIRILTRDACWPKPSWAELVAGSVQECKRIGARLLVVDTFAYWASLPKDAEKDAGAAQAAMQPLLDATRDGLAVFVPLHQRKGGGEDGEGVRGSGAIAGTADIVLELERVQKPRERVLLALSRYPSTPGSLLIERDSTTGAWAAIGEGERADARSISDRQSILAALDDGTELTRAELEEATGAPERQWHAQLEALMSDGKVQRTGAGKKGDPYRFAVLRTNAAQAPAQKRAGTVTADASDSAALHVVEQQKEASAATRANDAHSAESPEELQRWLRSLSALPEAKAEAEWQGLESVMRPGRGERCIEVVR